MDHLRNVDKKLITYIAAAECILENAEKFLIIKRPEGVQAAGLLAFPGGTVELDDGQNHQDILVEAAKREVKEEVGITVLDPLKFVTSSCFLDEKTKIPVIDSIFHCVMKKTQNHVTADKREVPEYYWLTRKEIHQHELSPPWLKHYISLI